jgi:hypothetical protein
MNGARFLLAVVVGSLIGAAIASCILTGTEIDCADGDSHYSCGQPDPCHCYTDTDANVGSVTPGACSADLNPCTSPTACGPDAAMCGADQICSLGVCQDKPDGGSDASADGPTADAGDASIPSCTGQCLPTTPAGWSAPLLLAYGDAGTPSCPAVAPSIAYEGSGGLTWAPATCGGCMCAPSEGTCILPATMTASVASCADSGPDSLSRPFGPSGGWDGGCSTQNAVPGEPCPKDSTTCIQSVTIAPLTVDESCGAAPDAAPIIPPYAWSAFAVACTSGATGACADTGDTCAPAGAEGFQPCVFQEGDVPCPGFSPYSEQLVFYGDADDTRGCSACTCGPVVGSSCSALISIYTDGACASLVAADTITTAATAMPLCLPVPAGAALGSVSADAGPYMSGTCQASDAGPTGSAQGTMPATFCCLPM